MRNLGGAIGIALIDTIVYGQAPGRGAAIAEKLKAGDSAINSALKLPIFLTADHPSVSIGPKALQSLLEPKIQQLALVETTNIAWLVIAVITALVLLVLPFAGVSGRSTAGFAH